MLKAAYEIGSSDWSSDVCSSVLAVGSSDVANPCASSRRGAAIDTARSYVLSRYREPLSLSSIAAACGVAPSTLCERFPRVVGMPVWRYVQRLVRTGVEQGKGVSGWLAIGG